MGVNRGGASRPCYVAVGERGRSNEGGGGGVPGGLKRRFGNATVKRGAAGRVWRLGTAPGGRTVRGVTGVRWRPAARLWQRDVDGGRRGGSDGLVRRSGYGWDVHRVARCSCPPESSIRSCPGYQL